jgi:hypothetical protein
MNIGLRTLLPSALVCAVGLVSGGASAGGVGESEHDSVKPYIGVFRDGMWYLDDNENHAWDGLSIDQGIAFGNPGDWPVALPAGICGTQLGAVGGSTWVPRGAWWGGSGSFIFGSSDAIPLLWVTRPVAFQAGVWLVDRNFDGAADERHLFGQAGDIPVLGGWGDTQLRMGVFDATTGHWYLETSGDNAWGRGDVSFQFGDPGDFPVVANFNPDRPGDEIGTFRDGAWYIDMNGNRQWNDDRGDATWFFGESGDIPVILYRCR